MARRKYFALEIYEVLIIDWKFETFFIPFFIPWNGFLQLGRNFDKNVRRARIYYSDANIKYVKVKKILRLKFLQNVYL